ncbi:MAG: AMP-binding protein, partial [Acidimicrobiia bacterium]|nr:AMP-binding protein [Acidimicrobiia bacterium]
MSFPLIDEDAVADPLGGCQDQASSSPVQRAGTAQSLRDIFLRTVCSYPKRVALEADGEVLTYEELHEVAIDLAGKLTERGAGPGHRIGVRIASGTTELYTAILGVLLCGACYVPVDADEPGERADQAWRAAGVTHVVNDGLAITSTGLPGPDADTATDDAWTIFTSGSTGVPKPVVVSHRSAAAFVDAETSLFDIDTTDRVAASLSVAFDASCEEMWLAWAHGAALVAAPRSVVRSGVDFGPWLVAHRISVVSSVPTLAALWDEEVIATFRTVILGGEPCPEVLAWRLAQHAEAWNTYGPTEATVVSTAARLEPGQPVRIGWPIPGWKVAVVDESGHPVASGSNGELVIAGEGLGRYLDPVLDAERFAPLPALGWDRAYRSGDIVRETPEGLVFVGRRDGQFKLGGRRVELGEIDCHLLEAPGVVAAAAAVRTTPSGAAILVGYVCGDVDLAAAHAHLSERLPADLVPTIAIIDALPTTTAGKVDRTALPWPLPTCDAVGSGLDGTARWLAECWAAELGPRPLDANSDFFMLGGTSIAVARLVSVLRSRYPCATVADVYHYPRLGDLAQRLDELGRTQLAQSELPAAAMRGWGAAQIAAVAVVLTLRVPSLVIGLLAYNNIAGGSSGPHVAWVWLALAWLLFVSAPGRVGIVVGLRRLLLRNLAPGRYPRYGSTALRVWFVEQVASAYHLRDLAGTPWAARYARMSGATVGKDVHLGTLPPPTSLIAIGDGATVETDVDLHGWWVEGPHLVIGEIEIGDGA